MYNYGMSIVLPCNKKRKHLEKVVDFWRERQNVIKIGLMRPQECTVITPRTMMCGQQILTL